MKTRLLIIVGIVSVFLLMPIDQSYAITNLIDEAKEKGLPYLTSVQVKEDILKFDENSLLILQVDFHSKNNTDIWIDIKPVVEKQFILYHNAGFSIASGIDGPYGGEVKNQHRIQDYVEYDDSVIRLNSNESKQILVYVEVPVEYLEKFQNKPLPILVGFELIDSNVLEKLPRDLEKLEIKYYSFSQDSIPSPLKQIKSGVALIDVQCSEGKHIVYKYDRMRVACVFDDTQSELWSRGWSTKYLTMIGENPSHALCNNYNGKWHPEYEGCRGNITNLQCSLMGGEFVDDLKICYNKICPADKTYTLCVTNLDLVDGEIENEN